MVDAMDTTAGARSTPLQAVGSQITGVLPPKRPQPSPQPSAKSEPAPVCATCQGKRWLWDAQAARLAPCGCWQVERQELLERVSGLEGEMLTFSLGGIKPLPGVTGRTEAVRAARELVQAPRWFFTVHGSYGVGKTHLLAAIVNDARRAGFSGLYTTMAQVLDHLRRTFKPGAEIDGDELWDRLLAVDVLAIDEIDRFNPTAWAQERFFMLLDARYRAGERQLTCFATNGALEELPGYFESRLQDKRCKVFAMHGSDVRAVRS